MKARTRRALRGIGLSVMLAATLAASGCASGRELNGVRVAQGSKGRALEPGEVAERSAGAIGVVVTDAGRGLGFIVDPAGYMLTNRHVVEDADYIEMVQFPGLEPAPEYTQVEIVYIDPVRDLALLRIHADAPLPYLQLATRERAPAGDYVTELDEVVLLSREVDPDRAEELDEDPGLLVHTGRIERLEVYNAQVGPGPFLGVSARIVQGQSGGPVLDRWGRAIGVVTWTWKDQKGGFAIPISEAARMLADRPKLETSGEQRSRAEDRARDYIAALGTASVDDLRRLTSPSLAREVRGETIDVLLDRALEGALQGFITTLEELMADGARGKVDPFEAFEVVAEGTGSDASMRRLGVQGSMSSDAVVAFFYEIGSAYMAARWFGDYGQRDALIVALQRVHSLDTARNIVLAESLDELVGVRAEVASIEVVEGFYAPQAIATVDLGRGKQVRMKMQLEWGDWYVVGIERSSDKRGFEPRSVGVQPG